MYFWHAKKQDPRKNKQSKQAQIFQGTIRKSRVVNIMFTVHNVIKIKKPQNMIYSPEKRQNESYPQEDLYLKFTL